MKLKAEILLIRSGMRVITRFTVIAQLGIIIPSNMRIVLIPSPYGTSSVRANYEMYLPLIAIDVKH